MHFSLVSTCVKARIDWDMALQNVMSHMQDPLESSEFAEGTLPREEGAVVLIVVVALSFENSKIKYDQPSSAPHFKAGEDQMLKSRLMPVIEQIGQ